MAGDTVITVVGNLTADPELRFTASGAAVANFTVASTPRTFDRGTNEWKDGEALFLRCNIWRQAAENVAESLTRGSRVIVSGRLKQRSFETKEGEKRTVIELEVDEIGPSLRYATAKVNRVTRTEGGSAAGGSGGSGSGGSGGGCSRAVPVAFGAGGRLSATIPGAQRSGAAAVTRTSRPINVGWSSLRPARSRTTTQIITGSTHGCRSFPGETMPKPPVRKIKKKVCAFCKDNAAPIDYKDTNLLRKFISDRGKIRARRVTGNCTQHQRDVATAVKNAREVALLPYTSTAEGGGAIRKGELMKLILTADVPNLGAPGDIVEVRDGYGRNFLLPQSKAIVATKGAEKQVATIKRAQLAREIRGTEHANEVKQALEKLTVSIAAHTTGDGTSCSAPSPRSTWRRPSRRPAARPSTSAPSTPAGTSSPSARTRCRSSCTRA